jgi:hypothetical protein
MNGIAWLLMIPQLFATAGHDSAAVDLHHLTGVVWQWVETFDPYEGGQIYEPDSLSADHTLLFDANGKFVEDYPGGCCRYEGKWVLMRDSTAVTLLYTDERRAGQHFTYELRRLSADTLQIGIRARHGVLIETYRPAEKGKQEK